MKATIMQCSNGRCLLWWPGIFLALALCLTTTPVSAFDDTPCTATYEDAQGNPGNTVLVLRCAPGFATTRDWVMVYAQNKTFDADLSWRENLTFVDEVWVFARGTRETTSLIIDFYRLQERLIADLYDDQDDDRIVAYRVVDGQVRIDESDTPTVRVVAPDGWWQRDGKTNFNLEIDVDGPVRASFTSEILLSELRHDGLTDFHIKVRDRDSDGRPEFQWVDAFRMDRTSRGIARTEVVVNADDDEIPVQNSIFWPFLGTQQGYTKSYHYSLAPIQVDWDAAQIKIVGEFVASRFNDSTWFVYSLNRVQAEDTTAVNFETPFGFYDMAEDDDGYPELSVRIESSLPFDQYNLRRFPGSTQVVRYSWDQDNNQSWDFKLDLIGRHTIDTVVTFPEFSSQLIPYDDLPSWVVEQPWDFGQFVAIEGFNYWTSEGIYEGPLNVLQIRDNFITGVVNELPEDQVMAAGFRSEYSSPNLAQAPLLYISTIDRKLHFQQAQVGSWNIDNASIIYYANLDGDAYFDQWSYFETTADSAAPLTRRQINVTPDYLLYAEDDVLQLRLTKLDPVVFEAPPPIDAGSWKKLGAQLERMQPIQEPGDFAAHFHQFDGPLTRIDGATLQAFRFTKTGSRFVIQLQPDYRVLGHKAFTLKNNAPGVYVVAYDADTTKFQVAPMTPLDISLTFQSPDQTQPYAQDLTPLALAASNTSLQDAQGVRLLVEAYHNELQSMEVLSQTIDVLAEQTSWVPLSWHPPDTGQWELAARLLDADGDMLAEASYTVETPARMRQDSWQLLAASSVHASWIMSLLVIMLLTGLAIGVAYLVSTHTDADADVERKD